MFGLRKLEDKDATVLINEVEKRADEILGPYGKKDSNSMMKIFGREVRVNHVLYEMGIETLLRGRYQVPVKKMQPRGNIGSERPDVKRKSNHNQLPDSASQAAPSPPATKLLEKRKRKAFPLGKIKRSLKETNEVASKIC